MRYRSSILAAVLVAALGLPRAEAAGTVTPAAEREARSLFERGEVHFRAGLFAEALAEYQAGYDIDPLPGFLINIAQCHRRLGHLEQALLTYRTFVMVAPDSRFVPNVKTLIAELERLVSAGPAPDETTAEHQPGPAAPAASEKVPQLSPSAPRQEERPTLLAAPEESPPPARTHTRWWLWGTVTAVVLAGSTATFFALRSPEATTLHDGTLGTLRR